MVTRVSCPICGRSVDPQARQCPYCSVDLARAAVLAEQVVASSASKTAQMPITPEILVPRIGEYLMERGVLSELDLQRALSYHQELAGVGKPRLVGQVLLELGLVDRETLDQVVTEQILELQRALQQSNRQLEQRVRERTRELQQALNKLAELNQLKSNFIANVSHELRTPLTHIKGYLDILADGSLGELNSAQSDALDVLRRSEDRLEELIDELLQFSFAASGALTLDTERVDLNGILNRVVEQAMRKAVERGIHVHASLSVDLPVVSVDSEKITWVFAEILDNAIKFTPRGGQVDIATTSEDNLVSVTVTDSGIGISPEQISEIFEPFHQLDGSVTRRYGGVGLGLSLVRKIVEAHGASIEVHSAEGQGSSFRILLPEA